MQATFDELGIELLKYGYRKVVFLEVECKIDGASRLGVSAELPIGEQFECPECHAQRPCSGILAAGYSRRPLPLEPEFWSGRLTGMRSASMNTGRQRPSQDWTAERGIIEKRSRLTEE
jgi:hypothetical protein